MRPLVSLHRLVRAVWAALLLTSLAGAPALAQEAPAATAADWLVPSDAVPGARFGADVALIGGGHLVVGAPGAHGERPRTGAAYVFTYDRDRLAWIETAKLTAPDGLSGDEFGARVRPHGTDTLHIEAARARTRYVFVRDASGWRYADQLRNAPEDGDLTVRGGDVTASASFEDLDGRTYQAVLSSDRDSTQLVIPINLVEGEDVTLAASLTDPDLQTADLASAQRFPAFDGRYLALGTPDVDGGGAVYVWTLAGRWVSDDLAPTLPGLQAKAGPEEYAEVEVFYGTDRARTGRRSPRRFYGGRRGGDLEVGTTTVTIPTSHKPGAMESPSWMRLQFRANPAKHIILKDVRPLDTDEAVAAMQAALDSTSSRAVLLYVHGFNVSFEDAARRAAQMAYDLDFDGIPAFYSWPSDASLLSYLSDENDVMWSVFHLKAFLRLLALQSGAEEVH
ncbi:MAG: alpha/beta hydrolase, partial [Bacteroidota bacterium]